MSKTLWRALALLLAMTLVAAACSSDDSGGGGGGGENAASEEVTEAEIDYEAIGLWDDGPCDEARGPAGHRPDDHLRVAGALAGGPGDRAGGVGRGVQRPRWRQRRLHRGPPPATTAATLDQAMACVREIDDAGVVATVNDQGTAGQAEVSAAMAEAGIPRVASNVTTDDWGDQNAYPLDASGTGVTVPAPAGADRRGRHRDRADPGRPGRGVGAGRASSSDLYEGEATFPYDVPGARAAPPTSPSSSSAPRTPAWAA